MGLLGRGYAGRLGPPDHSAPTVLTPLSRDFMAFKCNKLEVHTMIAQRR